MNYSLVLNLFSPRWGHTDPYSIELSSSEMKISMNARISLCKYRENLDPLWEGEDLNNTLANDSIVAPVNLIGLLQYAWTSWRDGELSDEQVKEELELVADWINTITKSRPQSDFWSAYF